jgi:UDP-N-acetylmuramate--alanine ligase
MRLRYSVAVAGAHGKTTTTSMVAVVLERAGLDPTAVIGGRLSAFGSSARLGRSELMVAEADESDRSFLRLYPTLAVVTNIDREHLENYGSFDELKQAFVDFANKVPFYGAVVACVDDPVLAAALPKMTRRVVTYGLAEVSEVQAADVTLRPFESQCTVWRRRHGGGPRERLGTLMLGVPGRHNVQNAMAAVAVGLELDVPFAAIAEALAGFHGAERRFQSHGEVGGVLVVDDYGHHPTEIRAVIAAARAGMDRRVVVVFQPHRFSRTAQLFDEFGPALAGADLVVLTDIYPAGEPPQPGVTLDALAASVRAAAPGRVQVVRQVADLPAAVAAIARPGDLVITLGAGSIGQVPNRLVDELRKRCQ